MVHFTCEVSEIFWRELDRSFAQVRKAVRLSLIQTSLFDVTHERVAKPFLKWAGGKTRLVPAIKELLPVEFQTKQIWAHRYFEPFMGSAAVFFELSPKLVSEKTFISDINQELVLTFLAVKNHVGLLLEALAEHELEHNRKRVGNEDSQREYYNAIRARDREEAWGKNAFVNPESMVAHAARFIYLNKTCFNGLWRVNSKGFHNVPMGRYKNPAICNTQLLLNAHESLQNVNVCLQSYRDAVSDAATNDLVYLDPPYMPLSATSSFNAYAKDAFLEIQHKELAVIYLVLASRGVHVILSNSDTPFTRLPLGSKDDLSNFIKTVVPISEQLYNFGEVSAEQLFEIYQTHWQVKTVKATRAINSKATKRGAITELLVSTNHNQKGKVSYAQNQRKNR